MNNGLKDKYASIAILMLPFLALCLGIIMRMKNYITSDELTKMNFLVFLLPHAVYLLLELISTVMSYLNNRKYCITCNVDKIKLFCEKYNTESAIKIKSIIQAFTFTIMLVYTISK